jgi:hypothetical protein
LDIRGITRIYEMHSELQAGEPISLQQAMLGCTMYNATDKRDKVFALLGISSDAGDKEFDPDYEASSETIYTRVSRRLLTRENASLGTLHVAGIGLLVLSLIFLPGFQTGASSTSTTSLDF